MQKTTVIRFHQKFNSLFSLRNKSELTIFRPKPALIIFHEKGRYIKRKLNDEVARINIHSDTLAKLKKPQANGKKYALSGNFN